MRTNQSALLAALLLAVSVPALTAEPAHSTAVALAADTPTLTATGRPFTAPKGWSLQRQGPVVLLTAPDGNSRMALIDIAADNADAAVAAAWALFDPVAKWPLKARINTPAHGGWEPIKAYNYRVEDGKERIVFVRALPYQGTWTLLVHDLADGIATQRVAELNALEESLKPISLKSS